MIINKEKRIEMLEDSNEILVSVKNSKRKFYFVILYLLFAADFISRIGINSIFPVIQEDMHLTDSQIGLLGGIVLLGMAVFVLPISFWGEKKSTRKAITISSIVWGIGSLLSGVAGGFGTLATSRFLVGVGNSAFAPLATSTITSWYKKSQWGKTLGIFNTAMTVGSAVGCIIFAHIASTIGWRVAFYTIAVVSIALSLLSLIIPDGSKVKQMSNKSEEKVKNKVNVKDALKSILNNKALIIMCIGAGIAIMALNALNSWTSIYFVREMGMSISQSAALVSSMAVLSIAGFPIGGFLLDSWYEKDKRSRMWLPAICIALCGVFYFIGFYFKAVPVILFAAMIYTFGGTAFHTASQELVSSWFKSVSYGTYVLFIQFLGAFGPIVTGFISQAFGLSNAILIVQGLFIISAIILIISSFLYIKYYKKARQEEKENLQEEKQRL